MGGIGMIRRLWNRLLIRLGIRKPYREPGMGRGYMLKIMEQRMEELENRRRWPDSGATPDVSRWRS